MSQKLEIAESFEGSAHVLTLSGRLDTLTAPQLDAQARRISAASQVTDVVIDMKECDYVSSAGLRVIISMQKRVLPGGSLRFRNVTPAVRDIFHASNFDNVLTIE